MGFQKSLEVGLPEPLRFENINDFFSYLVSELDCRSYLYLEPAGGVHEKVSGAVHGRKLLPVFKARIHSQDIKTTIELWDPSQNWLIKRFVAHSPGYADMSEKDIAFIENIKAAIRKYFQK